MCAPTWYSYQPAGNNLVKKQVPGMINHLGNGLESDSNKLTKGLKIMWVYSMSSFIEF